MLPWYGILLQRDLGLLLYRGHHGRTRCAAAAVNRRVAERKDRPHPIIGCGCLVGLAIIIGVVVTVCQAVTGEAGPRPWHERCLAAWDGSHRGLNNALKADLVAPDSFEHIDTGYMREPRADGTYAVRVRFSASNAFGARLRGVGWGHVDPTDLPRGQELDRWLTPSHYI